ncbi:hypothetical protein AK812_SmicGene17008 [Symbiodinium microadriaticum]|uniref:Uncharacterized protein n=1 Tax=Symbiodinium microadriaticum TaxID=2951 RepID=A0A1Q9DYU6_SYMMI|nr:hypothetical protein AK812_SmicGene17008 [Symbiodinium microadriaticum]
MILERKMEHGSKLAKMTDLPFDLSTYCCTQFVVARHRIARVPDSFWSAVWRSLHDRLSVNGTAVEGLDWTCRLPAKRVYEQRAERNGHMPISDYGLWGEVLERAWHWIFGEDALLPPREVDARLPLFLRIPRVRSDVEGGPRGTILDRVLLPDWGFDPGYWGLAPIIGNVTGEATAGSAFSSPIPTAHFARTARTNWQLPDWVAAWLQACVVALPVVMPQLILLPGASKVRSSKLVQCYGKSRADGFDQFLPAFPIKRQRSIYRPEMWKAFWPEEAATEAKEARTASPPLAELVACVREEVRSLLHQELGLFQAKLLQELRQGILKTSACRASEAEKEKLSADRERDTSVEHLYEANWAEVVSGGDLGTGAGDAKKRRRQRRKAKLHSRLSSEDEDQALQPCEDILSVDALSTEAPEPAVVQRCGRSRPVKCLLRFHAGVADTLLQLLPVQDIMKLRTTAQGCPAKDPEVLLRHLANSADMARSSSVVSLSALVGEFQRRMRAQDPQLEKRFYGFIWCYVHTRSHRADGSPALPWILTAITDLLELCSTETGAARAAAHHLLATLGVGSERVQQLCLQSGVVETTLASGASWEEKEAAMRHVGYSHRSLGPCLRKKWVGHLVDSLEPLQDDDEAFGSVDKVVHKLELLVGAVHAGHAGSGRESFPEAFAKLQTFLGTSASPEFLEAVGRFVHHYA